MIKVIHLFFIPLFAFGKNYSWECPSCKAKGTEKELNEQNPNLFNMEKEDAVVPFYYYLGGVLLLFLIAYFIVGNILSMHRYEREFEIYKADPQPGDYYVLEAPIADSEYPYEIYKLSEIDEENQYIFQVVNYVYESKNKASKDIESGELLKKYDPFSVETFPIPKAIVTERIADGSLVRIIRP